MRSNSAPTLALLALAACGGVPGDAPPATDEASDYDSSSGLADPVDEQMQAARSEEQDERTMASGRWVADELAGSPAALFGPPASEAVFSVRCDREARELVFSRGARRPEGEIEMQLLTEGAERTLVGRSQPEPLPRITARLPADDAFADRLADLAEPLTIRIADEDGLTVPAGEEFRRVVADC